MILCHSVMLVLFIMFVCCYHYVVNKDEYNNTFLPHLVVRPKATNFGMVADLGKRHVLGVTMPSQHKGLVSTHTDFCDSALRYICSHDMTSNHVCMVIKLDHSFITGHTILQRLYGRGLRGQRFSETNADARSVCSN